MEPGVEKLDATVIMLNCENNFDGIPIFKANVHGLKEQGGWGWMLPAYLSTVGRAWETSCGHMVLKNNKTILLDMRSPY